MQTVLMTCAGLRVDLVREFQRLGARVVAADCDAFAPTLHLADVGVAMPQVGQSAYLDRIVELVREHHVDLVVPLTDHDLVELAAAREELAPALLLLSPLEVVLAMWDKYACHQLLLSCGFGSPPTWLPDEVPADVEFPVLVKERWGTGGWHIYPAADREELAKRLAAMPMPAIVQHRCDGPEFSLDVFCDMDGRCLNVIPRQMLRVRGGETIEGLSVRDPELVEFGRQVAETLPFYGMAMVQLFREDGELLVTDVNPRFGGGAIPGTIAAGGEYAALALALARGERPLPHVGRYKAGRLFSRYWTEVVLEEVGDGSYEFVR